MTGAETKSILGLIKKDGQYYKRVRHHDGTVDLVAVDGDLQEKLQSVDKKEVETQIRFEERFSDTETIPAPWTPPESETLEKRSEDETKEFTKITHEEAERRAMRLEALLVQIFTTTNTGGKGYYHTRGSTAFKETLIKMCEICGGSWEKKIPFIIADDSEMI